MNDLQKLENSLELLDFLRKNRGKPLEIILQYCKPTDNFIVKKWKLQKCTSPRGKCVSWCSNYFLTSPDISHCIRCGIGIKIDE